jgi:poly(3-hydroxybutyrate) depolymerase
MTSVQARATVKLLALVALVSAAQSAVATAQTSPSGLLDEAAAPGANYDKAEFRFWSPPKAGTLRAVLVLVPGSNGDGRPAAEDSVWQAYAATNKLAIVACRFTDKKHDQSFIEDYVNVSHGSGQALLDALTAFAGASHHAELAAAPLLLWGMSAGGQFNYEFVAWKPERVVAFVVNKGGIYYTALAPKAARQVPGLLFIGDSDLDSRITMISGLAALNRRGGALWALTSEPGVGHAVARSRDLGAILFAEVLPLRVTGRSTLEPIDPQSGFIADLTSRTFQRASDAPAQTERTAWLPTLAVAKAWQAVVNNTPFEQ